MNYFVHALIIATLVLIAKMLIASPVPAEDESRVTCYYNLQPGSETVLDSGWYCEK